MTMKHSIVHKLSIVAVSFGMFVSGYAQKSDAQSKKILESLSTYYKAQKNNYFKFIYGSGSGKVSKSQTGIFYTTPTQYKLKIMGTEQIFDGSKVYNISEEEQEITIAKANGFEMTLSPTNYLNTYSKDYNTNYLGKSKVNNTSVELIKLTPIKNNGIKYVNIYANPATKKIVKIEQFSNNNEVATITITEHKANQNLSKDLFTFDKNKYKNYLITEL